MSVITWDGRKLATDRMANDGSHKWESSKAWYVTDSNNKVCIVSGVGLLADIVKMKQWFTSGAKHEDFPHLVSFTSQLIVVREDGLWVFEGTSQPTHHGFRVHAFGDGKGIAIGAMAMGATAGKAVEVANEYSLQCGKGVEVFSLKEGENNGTQKVDQVG